MAIKVQNTTVIDDSRNLTNIVAATVSGPSTISVNNATSPPLLVKQTGSGLSLLVKDTSGTDSTPFVVDTNGRVGIGTDAPPAATKLMINQTEPMIGLRTQGTSYNNVFGWTLREQNGNLLIDRRTSSAFGNFNAVLIMTSLNTVGINVVPDRPLDVSTTMAVQNSGNEGIAFLPQIAPTGGNNNVIWSRNSGNNNNRGLALIGERIRVLTGASTGSGVNLRMTVASNGDVTFESTLTANQFVGPGLDWYFLGSTAASGSSVDISISSAYKHYAILFHNIRSSSDAVLRAELRDSNGIIGSGTYKFNAIGARTNSTSFSIANSQAASFWQITALNITNNNVEGSASGELVFYNTNTSSRWKRITGSTSQYHTDGVVQEVYTALGGSLDSTTQATIIRLSPSAGNFSAGTFRIYGLRT
jgi:hypothetical protein